MTSSRISSRLVAFLAYAFALLTLVLGFNTSALAGPQARQYHVAVYDPVRQRMLVWGGGSNSTGYVNEVWSLNLDGSTPTWRTLALATGAGPSEAFGASAVYDPVGDRMVVFGGQDLYGFRSEDLHVLNLSGVAPPYEAQWHGVTLYSAPGGSLPSPTSFHTAVYDPVGQRMIVYGGAVYSAGTPTSDTWSISLAAASTGYCTLISTGGLPGARWGHAACYDPKYQRMLVSGGYNAPDGSVYALQLTGPGAGTWSKPWSIYGNTRVSAQSCFDASLDELVIWDSGNVYVARDWTDANTLSSDNDVPVPGGPTPYAHSGGSAIFDPCPAHPRMVLFGGTSAATGICDDLYALTLLEDPNYVRWDVLTNCPTVAGVTDLSAANGVHSVALQWTGVADQPPYGEAVSYEVRSSTSGPLTLDNFSSGTLVGSYQHAGTGQPQCASILGLPSCTHYDYAVRVHYADGTRSVLATASASTRCSGHVEVDCGEFARTAPPSATDGEEPLGLSRASGGRVLYVVPARLEGLPVDLALYDVRGRRLRILASGVASAGQHFVALGSPGRGIYFVRLALGGVRRSLTVPVLD